MSARPSLYALVLAGGAGTRFWPASRASRPKQLLPLTGAEPLLLRTVQRVLPMLGGWDHVVVASGVRLGAATAALLGDLPRDNLLLEPAPRNTAPCIGWAAARLARRDPDAIVMVLPSDHHVSDEPRFREVLGRAVASAAAGAITTIGIRPTHPETGFGYIEVDAATLGGDPLPVRRFVEKPDRARAEEFLASGRYLWNAGMFFFRVSVILRAIEEHLPELAAGLRTLDEAARAGREEEALARVFPAMPAVSINHGVMEHVAGLAVVPGDFGWSDVGSWQSAWELAAKDEQGNAAPAGTVLVDARNNQVVDLRSSKTKRVIALVGVDDLIVVETDDALLVAPKSRSQDVKDAVAALKERGDDDLT